MDHAQLDILDLIAAWVVVIDGEGRVVRPNLACVEALGPSVAQSLGERFWETFSDAPDRQRVQERVARLRESGADTITFEAGVLSKAGSRLWVAWTVRRAAPLGATGEACWIATGVDRTECKRAEEERAWSERIVASSEDAIVSSSPQGIIRTWNQAAVRIFVVGTRGDAEPWRFEVQAHEALELLQSEQPDLLISDIGMPYEDGYTLIRKVRALPAERGGRTPAVALTAYAREQDRIRALVAGFQSHVVKPVKPAELMVVVAQLAGRLAGRLDDGSE